MSCIVPNKGIRFHGNFILRLTAAILLAASCDVSASLALDHPANHRCRTVFGSFSAVPADTCPPDAVLCTQGELTGPLKSYDFVMWTLFPDADDPSKMFYTGESVIETRSGRQLFGQDTGEMLVLSNGTDALFLTRVNIVDGTNGLENASGTIWAFGLLSFVTGESEGIYFGKYCVPRRR